jgi:hypothetical protein
MAQTEAPRMHSQISQMADRDLLKRRVANQVFQKLAFTSFVIWTLGTLILFILFAASNPNPIFPTMFSMTTPLIPAFLVWALYRPIVTWRLERHVQADAAIPS